MKLFIKKIGLFSALAFLIYLLLILVTAFQIFPISIPRIPAMFGGLRYSNIRWLEAENQKNTDILVLGSSHAYRGFRPSIFAQNGLQVFNLGSSNQTPNLSELYLKKYVPKLKPRCIILECFWEMYDYQGIEAASDAICNHPDGNMRWDIFLSEPDLTTLSCLLATEMRRFWIPAINEKTNNSTSLTYESGGYVSCQTSGNVIEPILFSEKLNPKALEHAENIIQYAQNQNIKIILAITPVSHYYFSKIKNYAQLIQPFTTLAQKYKIQLIDFQTLNYQNFIDNIHFADSHHLNDSGVNLMNHKFLEVAKMGQNK